MKKLLIIADALDVQDAGVHYYLSEFLNALDKIKLRDTEVTVLRKKESGSFVRLKTLILPEIKFGPLSVACRLFYQIPRYAINNKYDFVFEPGNFGPFNLPKRIKRVTFVHDITPILFPQNHTFRGWFLHKLFFKSILEKTDYIFANSEWTKSDLINYLPTVKDKVSHNYLGIPNRFDIDECPIEYDFEYFLVVGSIEPRKGLNTILKSFELFKLGTKMDTKLIFVGPEGWKNEKFHADLNKHKFKKDIILEGYVSNAKLKSLYMNALTLLYASEYEGFGLPIVEAAYCNTPSIVARNSSLIEVGEICESTFFETLNSVDLCARMKEHVNVKKAVNNRDKMIELFSWDRHCIEFLKRLNLT